MLHHIIYIPGFGNHNPKIQTRILKRWEKSGIKTHFIPIDWDDNQDYQTKLSAVIDQIDELSKTGRVSLVGTSAGGSLAVNAYASRKDKLSGVVFICGKLRNAEGVDESYFKKHPAFKDSIFSSQANLQTLNDQDKSKMLTIRSVFDGLIPAHDSQIDGVKNRTLPILLHIPTIALVITVFKNIVINFLKSQAE